MATGDNRIPVTVAGKPYLYNPKTGNFFSKGGIAVDKPKGTVVPQTGLPKGVTGPGGPGGPSTGGGVLPGTNQPPATGGGGGGTGGGTTTPDPTKPPQPTTPLPDGFEWYWNGTSWVPSQIEGYRPPKPEEAPPAGMEWYWTGSAWSVRATSESTAATEAQKASLMAQMEDFLETYGLNTEGLRSFLQQAISQGWDATRIKLEIRKHPDYLANPLYAANLERTRNGGRFMSEGELKAYGDQAKSIAKRFGYKEPSDNYIAMGLLGGLSNAEFEHRLAVQDRVNQYGAGVGMVYRQLMGSDPTDQDLYEIFDPEKATDDFDNAARQAEMRGRPFTLGLGIRSEAEARALEMLGVNPDEAFNRYQGVAQNASRFERLGAIESMIGQGLPTDFGASLSTQENSLLIRGLVFQDQEALAQLQNFTAKEIARFRTGASGSQQQLSGLLSGSERATFG